MCVLNRIFVHVSLLCCRACRALRDAVPFAWCGWKAERCENELCTPPGGGGGGDVELITNEHRTNTPAGDCICRNGNPIIRHLISRSFCCALFGAEGTRRREMCYTFFAPLYAATVGTRCTAWRVFTWDGFVARAVRAHGFIHPGQKLLER